MSVYYTILDATFYHGLVAGLTEVNIALGKPAYMSSLFANIYKAHHGNNGNYNTFFHTDENNMAWWAIDFAQATNNVTSVRVTNRKGKYSGKCVRACVRVCVNVRT